MQQTWLTKIPRFSINFFHHLKDTNRALRMTAMYDSIEMGLLENNAPTTPNRASNGQARRTATVHHAQTSGSPRSNRNHDHNGAYSRLIDGRVAADSTQVFEPPTSFQSRHWIPLKLYLPWIWTLVLAALVVVLGTVYLRAGVITPDQKTTYNLASMVLVLLLGLSFFVSPQSSFKLGRY